MTSIFGCGSEYSFFRLLIRVSDRQRNKTTSEVRGHLVLNGAHWLFTIKQASFSDWGYSVINLRTSILRLAESPFSTWLFEGPRRSEVGDCLLFLPLTYRESVIGKKRPQNQSFSQAHFQYISIFINSVGIFQANTYTASNITEY